MKLSFMIALLFCFTCFGQNNTDTSLYMKSEKITYLTDIGSESGDLYKTIGHHGPAVENEWMALRIYFSDKVAIDVYSKAKPGLELKKAQWYPTPAQQKEGWGADYYKVASTVGLGGVKLWDGEKIVPLNPVSNRLARVGKTDTTSWMEMISRGVPYKGKKVDILVRVTVFSGKREAKVEAFSLNGDKVQFVTGINYFKDFQTKKGTNYIAVWGKHPEDVAAEIYPGVGICPYTMTGGTDAKFYKDICKNAMRFAPIYIDSQQYSSIHGINENIYQGALTKAVDFYKLVIKKC